jgi:hypothetical protein
MSPIAHGAERIRKNATKSISAKRTITVCGLRRAVIFVRAMPPAIRTRCAQRQSGHADARCAAACKLKVFRRAAERMPHAAAIRTFQKQHVEFQKLTSLKF